MKRALAIAAALLLVTAPALAGELTGAGLVDFPRPYPRPLEAGDVSIVVAVHDGEQLQIVRGVTVLQLHANGITDSVCGPSTEAPTG